jgi:hypothetical protein
MNFRVPGVEASQPYMQKISYDFASYISSYCYSHIASLTRVVR